MQWHCAGRDGEGGEILFADTCMSRSFSPVGLFQPLVGQLDQTLEGTGVIFGRGIWLGDKIKRRYCQDPVTVWKTRRGRDWVPSQESESVPGKSELLLSGVG